MREAVAIRPGGAVEGKGMDIQYVAADPYRAGACNIGPAEIGRRRRSAMVAIAVALALAVGLVVLGAPDWSRVLVLAPLAGGIISFEQARRRFCVAFGLAGIRNFGALGRIDRVEDDAARVADRRAALVMVGQGTAVAAVLTALFVLLPI